MAGPTHHLITKKLLPADIQLLQSYLAQVARIDKDQRNWTNSPNYWNIHLSDGVVARPRQQRKLRPEQWHPFIIAVEDLSVMENEEYQSVIPHLDWEFGSQIVLASMMKNLSSQRSMAQLSINLLKMFGGYICLLNSINPPSSYSSFLKKQAVSDIDQEAEITAYTAQIPGQIYKKYYEIEPDGRRYFSQIVDQQFMENWLADDRFYISS